MSDKKWLDVATGKEREFNEHTDYDPDAGSTPGAAEPKTQEVTLNAAEEKAAADGWVPQDQFTGDQDDWVEAKEYNFRGELMSRITKQSKLLKKQEKKMAATDEVIDELRDHQKNISQIEYNRAVEQLRAERAQAVEEGNETYVHAVDERMEEIKEAKTQQDAAHDAPRGDSEPDPAINEWLADPKNSWFHTDGKAQRYANYVTQTMINEATGPLDGEEVLTEMESKVFEMFPHLKDGGEEQQKPARRSAVNDGGDPPPKRGGKSRYSISDLGADEQAAAKKFVKLGVFKSEQEYVDDLASHDMIGE